MSEQNNSAEDHSDANAQPVGSRELVDTPQRIPFPPPDPSVVKVNEKDSTIHTDLGQGNADQIAKTALEARIKQAEIWMIVLTCIIAAATIAHVIVFYCESESTSKQIGELTTKAGGIVASMNTALSDNQKAISDAFAANKAAVDASTRQSKEALDEGIRS